MKERTGFPRSKLKEGMVVRLFCENDYGKEWVEVGTVSHTNWSGYLLLDDVDGQIAWDCIKKIELVHLLPPEE